MVIFAFPFYILSFGKHMCWKDPDIYIQLDVKLSWTIIVDITLEVKGWEATL